MKRFVELSGDLPRPIIGSWCVEVEAVFDIVPGRILKCTKRYAIVETSHPDFLASRLAMAHYVYRYLGTPKNVEAHVEGKYVVSRSRLGGRITLSVREALEIAKRFGAEPDLHAEREMILFFTEDGIHVVADPIPTARRKLRQRVPARRPVHEPPTLDPYKARFLVNLSRVPPGEYLLDPFCGFGGILLEAYDVNAKPVGIDLRLRALRGARKNFEHFFHEYPNLILGDATEGIIGGIYHVATDPPRGKMLKGLEARYKFLENTDARWISAVLGRRHEVGNPVYYGVLFEGSSKELRFVVYKNQ